VTISQIFIQTEGPITAIAHEAGRNPEDRVLVECVFIKIVTESEIYL
jgi:hypothetical protein